MNRARDLDQADRGRCSLCHRPRTSQLLLLAGLAPDCPKCALRIAPPPPAPPDQELAPEPPASTEPVHLILVSCGKTKRPGRHPARDLYQGPAFRDAYGWATAQPGAEVWILSAKHHAIRPDQELDAYDERLPQATQDRHLWGQHAAGTLVQLHHQRSAVQVTILAPADYADAIRPSLPTSWEIRTPLAGMGQGQRRGWFKAQRDLAGSEPAP